MFHSNHCIFVLLSLVNLLSFAFGGGFDCGACNMLLEAIETEVAKANPKEMVELGSYRVDPNGNQKVNSVPYKRSESHLHEVLEADLCKSSSLNWGKTTHPGTKREIYLNSVEFDGRPNDIALDKSDTVQNGLRRSCENILEDHEEEIIKILNKTPEGALSRFCVVHAGFCHYDDLVPYPMDFELPKSEEEDETEAGEDERVEL